VSLWHTLNLVSGVGLGATWLYYTISARQGIRQIADLTKPEYAVAPGTTLPRVSIIVPARNEAAMIAASVRSLLAIDYPDYELVVVDDRSDDATGEILDGLKSEYGASLTVVHVRELPTGWLGKTHAMWAAAKQATGAWILFSDADVIHAPDALQRTVHYAEQEQADHMVLLPTMLMDSVGERMMIPLFLTMFVFDYRPWKVRDPKARDSMGVGAFNMIRRSAYEKIGTYESMRLSVVDDMRLGEKVKQAGLPSRVAFGEGMVAVRWAVGARGVIGNLTKNFFAHLHYNIALSMAAVFVLLWLQLGPWVGALLATGWARAGYVVALFCLIALNRGLRGHTKIRAAYILLQPAASMLMVFTLLRSMVLTLAHGGVEWRGTFYPLKDLKKNS
jgi:glycosyltransferase involved in cell wall biosynthesis